MFSKIEMKLINYFAMKIQLSMYQQNLSEFWKHLVVIYPFIYICSLILHLHLFMFE